MQTFTQTFTGATTWKLEVPAKYFVILGTTLGVNVRFYQNGKPLDLGTIQGLLAGLEVGGQGLPFEFTRVEIDVLGADTVTVGLGNGVARYNRSQGNVAVIGTAKTAEADSTGANLGQDFTVGVASSSLGATVPGSKVCYLRSKETNTADIWIYFGGTAGPTLTPIRLAPGEGWIETKAAALQVNAIAGAAGQLLTVLRYA